MTARALGVRLLFVALYCGVNVSAWQISLFVFADSDCRVAYGALNAFWISMYVSAQLGFAYIDGFAALALGSVACAACQVVGINPLPHHDPPAAASLASVVLAVLQAIEVSAPIFLDRTVRVACGPLRRRRARDCR